MYFWNIILWQVKNQTSIRNLTTSSDRSWRVWFVVCLSFLQCIGVWQQCAHTYMYSRFGKSSQLLGIQSMLFSVRILEITTLKISHIYNNTNRLTCVAQKFKKHFRIIKTSSNQTIKAIMQEVEYSHSFQSFRQCSVVVAVQFDLVGI